MVNSGFYKGPLCPTYGFGALFMTVMFLYFTEVSTSILLLISVYFMIVLELWSGIYVRLVYGRRAWDYSQAKYNIGGHIDALHSVYWFLLVFAFYFLMYPQAYRFLF